MTKVLIAFNHRLLTNITAGALHMRGIVVMSWRQPPEDTCTSHLPLGAALPPSVRPSGLL